MRFAPFVLLFAPILVFAAQPKSTEFFTEKERAQGHSDRVILAKPRPQHGAAADSAERRSRMRMRERFARFGDLRVIELAPGDTVASAVKRLRETNAYEFVEPDYIQRYDAVPNDTNFVSQWSLQNTGQLTGSTVGVDIKAVPGWDIIREAPNVIVAVVDSGINVAHQDIAPNLWRNPAPTFGDVNGASFLLGIRSGAIADDGGHGTHVAGIIGAAGNNGVAIAGVAWKVQLMVVKNGTSTGSFTSDSAACIDYAVSKGAKIINCSFGGLALSQTLFTAVKAARAAGVIVVCAAGNSGVNNDISPHYPSGYLADNVVSVGNSGPTDLPSASSDFGGMVELYAPGTSIISLNYLSATGTLAASGTSMSAPHVTGTLALLKARFPDDTYRQLINRLLRGVDRTTAYTGRAQTGGRLNLRNALNTATNRPFNDDFAQRAVLAGTGSMTRSNNSGASAEAGEPNHANLPPGGTLWWQWTATVAGSTTVHTLGSDFDTVVSVYRGTTLASLIPVASNDDANGNKTSSLTFQASLGVTYQFAVGGKSGATGFTVLTLGSAPANDDFASATAFPAWVSATARGTNAYSTIEPSEPRVLGIPGASSVWYRWTAPRGGRYQFTAFSPTIDCLLGVYTGSSINALTFIAGNDDAKSGEDAPPHSLVTIEAQAGVTYAIKVDSKDPALTGSFVLTLTDSTWQFVGDGPITSAPAVATDGTIYTSGGPTDPTFYAIASDGALKWTYAMPGIMDICAPALGRDGTIYFSDDSGIVTALKPDGSLRWKRDLESGEAPTSPAVGIDGTVYAHTVNGFLFALDGATGAIKWSRETGTLTFAGPSIAPDGTVYLTSSEARLDAFNPDGTTKWEFETDSDSFSGTAIDAQGNLFFTTYDSATLWSVTSRGESRWTFDGVFPAFIATSPTLSADGTVAYFGATNRNIYAINTADGSLRWRLLLGDVIFGSTAAIDANGLIYVGCLDGRVYAINPTGTINRTWDTAAPIQSSPVIANGRLYIGSNDFKLYAFDLGAEAGAGPWPQFQQNAARSSRLTTSTLAVLTQPQSQTVVATQPLTLFVGASGSDPVTFQWRRNGVPIVGANGVVYTVPTAAADDAASYTVTVSSPQGTFTSAPAVISIEPRIDSRFANFSVRAAPGPGAQILTLGVTVGSGRQKTLLIRGIGPTLGSFGLPDTLLDPTLRLLSGVNVVGTNDNWGGEAELANASRAAGAFSLPLDSRDAVLLQSLSPGGYTAQISSVNTTTGLALAEIYDTEPPVLTAGASRVVNLAARGQVGTGNRVMVAGFVISGNVPKTVLIRALGPAIAALGVPGALSDPLLEVYRGSTFVGGNDDWEGDPALRNAFAQVNAFPIANAASRDSAMILTLQPGAYTAKVAGFLGVTGVALVEIYELK